jgi:hypothetical protein
MKNHGYEYSEIKEIREMMRRITYKGWDYYKEYNDSIFCLCIDDRNEYYETHVETLGIIIWLENEIDVTNVRKYCETEDDIKSNDGDVGD